MKLISVNVSLPRLVEYRGQAVPTGIFKVPVPGRIRLNRLNLVGDGQADPRYHGGLNKAVYAYPWEHYADWASELRRTDLAPGQFGENLTVEGLREDTVSLGDVYRIGTARLEVTQPRVPCYKLGIKMGSQAVIKQFLHSGRTGFYLRVLDEGDLTAGDAIELLERIPDRISVRDLWHLTFFDPENVADARRALARPNLGPEWTEPLMERVYAADRG